MPAPNNWWCYTSALPLESSIHCQPAKWSPPLQVHSAQQDEAHTSSPTPPHSIAPPWPRRSIVRSTSCFAQNHPAQCKKAATPRTKIGDVESRQKGLYKRRGRKIPHRKSLAKSNEKGRSFLRTSSDNQSGRSMGSPSASQPSTPPSKKATSTSSLASSSERALD